MEKLLSTAEVAERYNVAQITVLSWIRQKKLAAMRIGGGYRITESALAAFEDYSEGRVNRPSPAPPIPEFILGDSVRIIENDERGALIVFNDSVLPYITVNNLPVILSKLGITDEKTIRDVIAEFTRVATVSSPSPAWKTDYAAYQAEEQAAYEALANDAEFIAKCQGFHPKLDIPKSLRRSHEEYWATEAGWENKRNRPSRTINWRMSYQRNLDKSPVWKDTRPQMTNYLGGSGGDWQYTPPPSGGEGVK